MTQQTSNRAQRLLKLLELKQIEEEMDRGESIPLEELFKEIKKKIRKN